MTVEINVYCDHCSKLIMNMDAMTLTNAGALAKQLRLQNHICEPCKVIVGNGHKAPECDVPEHNSSIQ